MPADGVRSFVLVSVGQFIAVSGVTIFNFAAAYYVYRNYSVLVLGIFYALPFVALVVASPITGSLIDRWGTRRSLLVSNLTGLLLVCTLVVVPFTHRLSTWHGFVIVVMVPLLKALLLPAFEATVPFLVPKRHIGRANGIRMIVNGAGAVLGPVVAVPLLDVIGIYGVGLVAFVTLAIGVASLLSVHIPHVHSDDRTPASSSTLVAEFMQVWHYIRNRPGLPALLVFFGITSFGLGFTEVLLPQLLVAFTSDTTLEVVLAIGLAGMAAMTVAMTIWGGPRRRVYGLLCYSLLFAAAMVVGSLRPNVALIAVAAFVFLGTTPVIIGHVQTLLNIKVAPEFQGRMMGLKNSFYGVLLMAGNILAGFGGGLLQPLIGKDHVRSRALVPLLGNGPDRGFALALMLVGLLTVLALFLTYRRPQLRELEDRLPDVTPEDLALQPAPAVAD